MAIITSLLDTDLYKITMMYAVLKTCGDRMRIDIPQVQYRFKCRNKKNLLPYMKQIVKEVEQFKKLRFTKDDIRYIMSLGYFEDWFANYLQFVNLNEVQVAVYEANGELNIDIDGRWVPAILFEVPLLSIVNEIYFKHQKVKMVDATKNLKTFIKEMKENNLVFADFGTRRRFSKAWQDRCIFEALKANILTGTSNIFYAKGFGIKPVGTMAHEWLQGFQALSPELINFQKDALNHWMLTYRGKLDTALTDILGIDTFLKDWDPFFAKNYSCLRHDSGSPIDFINKVIHWYRKNNFHADIPVLLFSDGLTPETCKNIQNYRNNLNLSLGGIRFGIGTNFTNNVGVEPLQIVIKLAKVEGKEVIKISDSAGKAMVKKDSYALSVIKETFNLK